MSSCHCLRANGRRRARRSFGNIEEQQRGARAHGEGCRITVFIHGEALYGRASEKERELLLAATVHSV